MKSLKQMLGAKNRQLVSVGPNESIFTALTLMSENDIGALLVMDNGAVIGIFSERDFARKMIGHSKSLADTQVKEFMVEKVVVVTLVQTVEECLAVMTEHHFRHLPVVDENEKIVGIVSIGDLVKETIAQQAFVINQLEHYIHC